MPKIRHFRALCAEKLIKIYKKPLQKQRKARFCGLCNHELKVHGITEFDTI
jgi:hypothetical protein